MPPIPTGVIGIGSMTATAEFARLGPVAVAEDSWDEPPPPIAAGGRHIGPPSRRLWFAVVGVLMGLGAIAAVPFALSSQPQNSSRAAPDELPTELDVPPSGFVPGLATATTAVPMPTGQAATPAPTLQTTQAQVTVNSASSSTQPAQPTTPAAPPPFAPLTIEAESGQLAGSAWVWNGYPNASGGLIVRNLGNWGGTPGTLTLSGVVFPNQATYTITIYFVHPNGEVNRSAVVTVSGVPSVTVNFTAPNSECCFTQPVSMTIPAGTRSITFENPTSHAPSIDKIVITRG
jgi:hypothetical protein